LEHISTTATEEHLGWSATEHKENPFIARYCEVIRRLVGAYDAHIEHQLHVDLTFTGSSTPSQNSLHCWTMKNMETKHT